MIALTRLWYLAAKRKAIEGRPLFLLVLSVVTLQGIYTIARPVMAPASYLYGLFASSLVLVVFLPVMFRVGSVLSTTRLDLLPLSPTKLFLVRTLFGNPVRTTLGASAFLWGCVSIFLLPAPWLIHTIQVPVLGMLIVGVLAGAQAFEDALSPRLPVFLYITSVIFSIFGLQLIFFYAEGYQELIVPFLEWTAAVLLEGAITQDRVRLLSLALLLIGSVIALRSLFAFSRRLLSATNRFGGKPPRSLPLYVGQVIRTSHAATLAREIALALRLAFYRAFVVMSLALAALAVATQQPLLLLTAFFPFLVFLHNSLGADIVDGGVERLQLLPIQLKRLLIFRHGAASLAGLSTTSVALAIGRLLGSPMPVIESVSIQALGVGIIAFSTVSGDRSSIHKPKAVALDTVLLEGGFVRGFGWIGVVTVCVVATAVPISVGAMLNTANAFWGLSLHALAAVWVSTFLFGFIYVAKTLIVRRG